MDHAYWGRPEDMTMYRPSFKITASSPGSDLAGETCAALAAAAVFYWDAGQSSKANEALTHAQQLFQFADQFRGKYSDSIPEAFTYYRSWTGYGDELAWCAAWLHHATGDSQYLSRAESLYDEFGLSGTPDRFDWDGKAAGVTGLLFALTGKDKYRSAFDAFADGIIHGKPK